MLNRLKNFFSQDKQVLITNKIEYSDFCFLKQIYQGKKLKLVTLGKSMWPTIKENQTVEIEVISSIKIKDKIKKNTIIAFYYQPQGVIAHRVVEIRRKGNNFYYQTKGDNIDSKDLILISPNDILGIVLV